MNGDALRQARERAGLTQAQAARRIGVPVDTYRSWEHGRRSPRPELAPTIEAVMANEPTPKDEIAALRELVSRLAEQVQNLHAATTELAVTVARHEAELAQLQARSPQR